MKLLSTITIVGFVVCSLGVQAQNCASINQVDCREPYNVCTEGPLYDPMGQVLSCKVPGTFALTFDDGPSNYTLHLLDIFKQYNMTATFFVIGQYFNIPGYTKIVQRAANEGHQIASHTYGHNDLTTVANVTDAMLQFEKVFLAKQFNGSLSNVIPKYFRYPFGKTTLNVANAIKNLGYITVAQSFDSFDTVCPYNTTNILTTFQSVFGGSQGQGVLVSRQSHYSAS